MNVAPQQYVFRWGLYRPELKGRKCVILTRGATSTALVQFEDGVQHVVSRNALMKVKG